MAHAKRITNVALQLDADEHVTAMQVHTHLEIADPEAPEAPFTKAGDLNAHAALLTAKERTEVEGWAQRAGEMVARIQRAQRKEAAADG